MAIMRNFINDIPLREVSFAYTRNYTKKRILDLLAIEIQQSVPTAMLDKTRGSITEWRLLKNQ